MAGDLSTPRAAGGVPLDGRGEVDIHLVGQRGDPRQHVGELVLALGGRALAHRSGQLADLLSEPRHRRRHAATAVPFAVRALDQPLEGGEVQSRGGEI